MIPDRLRAHLESWLIRLWFGPARPLDRLLAAAAAPIALPLSALVGWVARRRWRELRHQPLPAAPGTVPVVIVGNLLAGGTGKSPLVIALAQGLRTQGFRPGLLARGYRAADDRAREVPVGADPDEVGDEPAMLVEATGLPMAVGARRGEALALLQARHPQIDVVLADDGLQHVGLPRALELVVLDGRGLGNGRCLPAGPLREPADRLARVDALIFNGPLARAMLDSTYPADSTGSAVHAVQRFESRLEARRFRTLDGRQTWTPAEFADRLAGQRAHAIAGLARPERFFDQLAALGIDCTPHPLVDHARIDADWLAGLTTGWVLMTAKDAIKCQRFAPELRARCVCLDVEAVPEAALLEWLVSRLRPPPGDPAPSPTGNR